MSQPAADWLSVIFFLGILILARTFGGPARSIDRTSYRYMSIGLCVITGVALLRLYGNLGMLDPIPFLSDPIVFRLITWTGMLAGLTFLISGVSTWLPMARRHRMRREEQMVRLHLIKEIEQLVAIEHRPDALLSRALSHILAAYNLEAGMVFRLDRDNRLLSVIAGEGLAEESLSRLVAACPRVVDSHTRQGSRRLAADQVVVGVPESTGTLFGSVTVTVDGHPAAAFLLWGDEVPTRDAESRINLRMIGDILERGLQQASDCESRAHALRCLKTQLLTLSDRRTRSAGTAQLPELYELLNSLYEVDVLSLRLFRTHDFAWDSYTVGRGGRLLQTSGIPDRDTTSLEQAVSDGEFVISEAERLGPLPGGDLPPGIHQVLACPIRTDQDRTGWLIAGSACTEVEEGKLSAAVQAVLPSVYALVQHVDSTERTRREHHRLKQLEQLLDSPTRFASSSALCLEVAGLIADELKVEAVRICVADASGRFLNSRAIVAQSDNDAMAPEDSAMILSLMPVHREVTEQRGTVLLGPDEVKRRVPDSEQSATLGGALSHLLIAVGATSDSDVAVISVADRRENAADRLNDSAVLFVQLAARLVSLGLRIIGDEVMERRAMGRYGVNSPARSSGPTAPRSAAERLRTVTGIEADRTESAGRSVSEPDTRSTDELSGASEGLEIETLSKSQ